MADVKGFKDRLSGTPFDLKDATARAEAAKAVKTETQSLTDEQKGIARTNIGAADAAEVASALADLNNTIYAQALVLNAEGSTVEISDAAGGAARSVDISIVPVQSGSGDPMPDNVRPIAGWDAATLIVSPTQDAAGTEYEFEFPVAAGTVYGGRVHVGVDGTAKLIVDRLMVTLDENNDWIEYAAGKYLVNDVLQNAAGGTQAASAKCMSNQYKLGGSNSQSVHIILDKRYYQQPQYSRIWVYDSAYETLDEFKAALALVPLVVVYPIVEPIEYDLTAQVITLNRLYNRLSADTGDVALEYNGDLKTYIDNLLGGQSAANTLSVSPSPLSMGAMQLGNTLSPAVEEPETTESEQE